MREMLTQCGKKFNRTFHEDKDNISERDSEQKIPPYAVFPPSETIGIIQPLSQPATGDLRATTGNLRTVPSFRVLERDAGPDQRRN